LVLTTDLDTTDTHTYQLVDKSAAVVTNGGSTAVVTDLSVVVAANGTYTVNGNFDHLAAGETATVTFQYTATDDSGTSNAISAPKTVTLTVTGTNDQPIVSDVTTTATETNGTQTFSGQLALTTDLDTTDTHTFQQTGTASVTTNSGAAVSGLAVAVATNGTYTVNGNFDHLAAGETATVTFQYTATDDSGTSNAISAPKTVTLTVTGTNDQPIVSDVTTTATETNGTQTFSGQLALTTDLDTTDTHVFQQFGTAAVVTNGGSTAVVTDLAVAVAANGAYTVAGNFDALAEGETATVTFQYVANDQNGFNGTDGINESSISEPKTVTITVAGTNEAPVANPDTLSATEDTTVTYTAAQLLGNDTDVDTAHTSLTIASVTSGNNGTVVLNVDGTVTFTPTKNYSGQADFTYTTTDGALTSNSALVTVNVIPVADAPILTLDPIKPFTVTENFEELSVGAYSQTVVPTDLTGTIWYTDNASGQIEIGQEKTYLANGTVNNVIELERDIGEVSNLYTEIQASLGDTYTLSFDYSPRVTLNGLNSSVVNVVLDGVTVKTLDTSTPGFINYTLILPILTDSVNGKYKLEFIAADKNSIGGLLDNITLSEMMNTGMAGSPIHLSSISSSAIHYALTDTDGSETLSLTIGGLPTGFILSDGTNVFEASAGFSTATVTGWNLDSLTVTPLSTATGTMVDLTITATSTEGANGDQASTSLPLHLTVMPSSADDTIVFDTMYTSIDGGAGTDTLILGLDTNIDFSALGNVIHNIEIIDLGQNGAHTLDHLTVQDVMDMTDPTTHNLIILGGADDTVNLDSTGGVWTKTGTTDTSTIVGHTLDIYTNSADATVTLKIEDTTHTIV
jgi:VCBS repeat-containing protein